MADETYAGEFYCVKCREKREAEGTWSSPTAAAWPRPCAPSAAPSSTASSARPERPPRARRSRGALPRPAPSSLHGDDVAGFEYLTAPHAPGLTALECALEAGLTQGAARAQRLGLLELRRAFGEEQIGSLRVVAGQAGDRSGVRGGDRQQAGEGGRRSHRLAASKIVVERPVGGEGREAPVPPSPRGESLVSSATTPSGHSPAGAVGGVREGGHHRPLRTDCRSWRHLLSCAHAPVSRTTTWTIDERESTWPPHPVTSFFDLRFYCCASSSSTCWPYLSSLAGPMPGTPSSSCSVRGIRSARASRVASVNTV